MTTGTSKVSTSSAADTLLLNATSAATEHIVILNVDAGSSAGFWKVGTNGELRRLPIGVTSVPCIYSNASIYLVRDGASNLVNVEAYTLP